MDCHRCFHQLQPWHISESCILPSRQKLVCYTCIPCSAHSRKYVKLQGTSSYRVNQPTLLADLLTASHIRPSSGFGSLSNNPILVNTVEMFSDGCHAPCLFTNTSILIRISFNKQNTRYYKLNANHQQHKSVMAITLCQPLLNSSIGS